MPPSRPRASQTAFKGSGLPEERPGQPYHSDHRDTHAQALKFNGVLEDFFLLHHPRERAVTYDAWARPGYLPPVWPPPLLARFMSEDAGVSAPGSGQVR